MAVSKKIKESIGSSSLIRKMFEEGIELKKKHGDDKVFDFSLGNPDLTPPAKFYEVIAKFSSERIAGTSGYMPNAGFPDVRKKIAAKASKEHGVELNENSIIMTVGAAGGLNVILKTILNPGDEIIVPSPYFVEYGSYAANHGGILINAKTNDDFSLNLQTIKEKINEKTAAVLINSPNNPTGRIYSQDEIAALGKMLLEESGRTGRTIHLIADEPYREITYDGKTVPHVLAAYKNSIVVTSYSKSLSLPGERIGYIAVNPSCDDFSDLISGMIMCNRVLGFVNAPAMMQRAVAELADEKVDVDTYQRRRDLLAGGLKDCGYSFANPEGAFYIFCKAPGGDDMKFVEHLKKYLILAVPGRGFGGPGYFRLSYCVSEATIKNSIPAFRQAYVDWENNA